jgi:hypothetical protein
VLGHRAHGVMIKGDFFFADHLPFKETQWEYCTDTDRRFWSEHQNDMIGGANVQLTNSGAVPHMPQG